MMTAISGKDEFRRSWRVPVGGTITGFFISLLWYSFGVFIGPLSAQFGWSSSFISGWFFFFLATTTVSGPISGRLLDRFGARRFLFVTLPLYSLGIAWVGLLGPSKVLFYLTAIVVGSCNMAMPALARTVNGWFTASRGVALAMIAMGIGVSTTVGPRLLQMVVDLHGWRFGFIFLGALSLVPMPLVYSWMHERRESKSDNTLLPEPGLTTGEILQGKTFWLIAAGAVFWGLAMGCSVHFIPFLTSLGLTRAAAANMMVYLGVGAMLGKVVSGSLLDRIHPGYVCATVFFLSALALASLALFKDQYAVAAIFTVGATLGSWITLYYFCAARFFGMRSYGEVTCLVGASYNIGWGIGPVLFALLRESSGNYRTPFLATACFAVVASVAMMLLLRCPTRPSEAI